LTDAAPGEALRVQVPARPPELRFAGRHEAPAMPAPEALREPGRRAIAHHIMANHELQACEVMAWMLLEFPEAHKDFRIGLGRIIQDEQRHTRMHIERAAALGLAFGALPVNGYIWKKSQSFAGVLDYLAGLPLVFEGRNLDHTLEFERYFLEAGDTKSAAVVRAIHRDEIEHVRFGLEWLRRLKRREQSDWDAWHEHLLWPLRPEKARGDVFDRASREAAGMTGEFIERLASS
jgi:uncharacterized ferritin-like protein (DUF455 family)